MKLYANMIFTHEFTELFQEYFERLVLEVRFIYFLNDNCELSIELFSLFLVHRFFLVVDS